MSYTDTVCELTWNNTPEWDANARLIALAPTLARQVIAARKLVEALRFYSDADNWNCEDGDWEMAEAISDTATDDELATLNIISVIEADGGKAARAALAEWETTQPRLHLSPPTRRK